MATLAGFDFFPLSFDGEGVMNVAGQLADLQKHIAKGTTDLVFFSHGFRNNEAEARSLYSEFLKNFKGHFTRPEFKGIDKRRFTFCGIFWPSKAFSEGPTSPDAEGGAQSLTADEEKAMVKAQLDQLLDKHADQQQKDAVKRVRAQLDNVETSAAARSAVFKDLLAIIGDENENDGDGLIELRTQPAEEVFRRLEDPIILPTASGDSSGGGGGTLGLGADEGGVLFIGGFFKSVAGRVGQLLNITTWYMMKNRSGTVGARALAPIIQRIREKHPTLRVHLVGHSLGGRLMTSCCKALAISDPVVRPDSLTLLEAAFSHYGFSLKNPVNKRGFFREVIEKRVVTGPMIATYSVKDTVVGMAYALASRLSGDTVEAIGDANDKYGGIGRNGAQKTTESTSQKLHQAGAKYAPFAPGVIHSLDGSEGLITGHGDVKNPAVTYAFATVVQST